MELELPRLLAPDLPSNRSLGSRYIFALFSESHNIMVSFSLKLLTYSLHIRYIFALFSESQPSSLFPSLWSFCHIRYIFITYSLYSLSPSRHHGFLLFEVSDIFATYSLHIRFILWVPAVIMVSFSLKFLAYSLHIHYILVHSPWNWKCTEYVANILVTSKLNFPRISF